jgi:hypothetical protein
MEDGHLIDPLAYLLRLDKRRKLLYDPLPWFVVVVWQATQRLIFRKKTVLRNAILRESSRGGKNWDSVRTHCGEGTTVGLYEMLRMGTLFQTATNTAFIPPEIKALFSDFNLVKRLWADASCRNVGTSEA